MRICLMTRLEIENEIQQINEEFGLTYSEDKVTTTSLKVAEIYEKQHKQRAENSTR